LLSVFVQNSSDNDAPDSDRQIRCERTSFRVLPQQTKTIVRKSGKHFHAKRIAVFDAQSNFPFRSGVIDDMQNETEKSVHEVLPAAGLSFDAAYQQFTIQISD